MDILLSGGTMTKSLLRHIKGGNWSDVKLYAKYEINRIGLSFDGSELDDPNEPRIMLGYN